jgi:hypothetical protein
MHIFHHTHALPNRNIKAIPSVQDSPEIVQFFCSASVAVFPHKRRFFSQPFSLFADCSLGCCAFCDLVNFFLLQIILEGLEASIFVLALHLFPQVSQCCLPSGSGDIFFRTSTCDDHCL